VPVFWVYELKAVTDIILVSVESLPLANPLLLNQLSPATVKTGSEALPDTGKFILVLLKVTVSDQPFMVIVLEVSVIDSI
jgi:hypothetical protein